MVARPALLDTKLPLSATFGRTPAVLDDEEPLTRTRLRNIRVINYEFTALLSRRGMNTHR